MFKYKKYLKRLEEFVNDFGCDLVYFKYDRRVFGNMHVIIRKNGQLFEYFVDRGDICDFKGILAQRSDVANKRKTPFGALLEVLAQQLSDVEA
ncbi:MAG: hypothetical protein IIW63_07165 [Clostridia bacterium]|nr:hypothetical protein [Clostridia bacterium]